ncbi:cAMP regulatory protein [Hartmannibacter diazotrophicus]|uniref:cAMP regulatory protein n=1 Tax=Hartmannibacter diazotrophicus TaxID=1482074 RepID=A0A2C9DCD3_9HYPH|nr:cyclic nucleotide-binding domain-containing protein [Hartmannibacter diazotrophicus]SON57381.1 cAMP regulatory protein [Hartmannibacter diazotrophicus]
MLLKDEVKILRRLPLFAGVEPTKLKLLAFTSDRLRYAPGGVLFRQGDMGDAAYVILSGIAEVLIESPAGPIKVAEVREDAIVGEIAILCDVARTATVRAMTDLDALRINKEHFLNLMKDYPEITIEVIRELANRLSVTSMELSEERAKARRHQEEMLVGKDD